MLVREKKKENNKKNVIKSFNQYILSFEMCSHKGSLERETSLSLDFTKGVLGGERLNATKKKIECHAHKLFKTSFLYIDLQSNGAGDRNTQKEKNQR